MISTMSPKILIVDDDPDIRALMKALLGPYYEISCARDGREAIEMLQSSLPDLVLLDIQMPRLDGLQVCRAIKGSGRSKRIPVIIVSAQSSQAERQEAFQAGADDYVVKPIQPHDFLSRIELHFRLQQAKLCATRVRSELARHNSDVRVAPQPWLEEVSGTQDAAFLALAHVGEARDEDIGSHILRIRGYAQILAEDLRQEGTFGETMDEQFMKDLYRASPLHDIGKVGISDAILRKPGPLTADEFDVMKRHTVIGSSVFERVMRDSCWGGFLLAAATITRFHHERFDGRGYQAGLVGRECPLPARIVAVADVYDALTSKRPYKDAIPPLQAKEMIEAESQRHFDPLIVAAFRRSFDRMVETRSALEQGEIPCEDLSTIVETATWAACPPPPQNCCWSTTIRPWSGSSLRSSKARTAIAWKCAPWTIRWLRSATWRPSWSTYS